MTDDPHLPTWAQDLTAESSASRGDYAPRLIAALAIAWEALEHFEKIDCSNRAECAKLYMRRIEELGKCP